MYNMYHGHAPSYPCDLLAPLVRSIIRSNSACQSSTKQISSLFHQNITCSRRDIAKNKSGVKQRSFNHSITQSHFLLKCRLYSEKRTPAIIFGQILELYYLETLKRTRQEIFCYQKQYRHSLRIDFMNRLVIKYNENYVTHNSYQERGKREVHQQYTHSLLSYPEIY